MTEKEESESLRIIEEAVVEDGLRDPLKDDEKVLFIVRAELARARRKFSTVPEDRIHAAAIVAEETGELVRAALKEKYELGDPDDTNREALHVIATAVRFLTRK